MVRELAEVTHVQANTDTRARDEFSPLAQSLSYSGLALEAPEGQQKAVYEARPLSSSLYPLSSLPQPCPLSYFLPFFLPMSRLSL